jgi:hypothetical protein
VEMIVTRNWILMLMVMMIRRSIVASRIWIFKDWKIWRLMDIIAIFTSKSRLPTPWMLGGSIRSWIFWNWLQNYMLLNQSYLSIIFQFFSYKLQRRRTSSIPLLGSPSCLLFLFHLLVMLFELCFEILMVLFLRLVCRNS